MAPAPPNSQVAPLPTDLPFRLVSKTIGQGAYASIRKAIPMNAPKPVIAIKFINKEHAFKHGRLTPKQLNMEITLHKYLGKHQNIIHCMGNGEDMLWTWIAMELADGGDLFDKIEPDAGVGEDIAHFYFVQMINAVEFMHDKGIAHRDLKPENVLLSAEGDLKLADFGLAALYKKDGQIRLCNTVCGSPPYIAPEVVSGTRSKRLDMLDKGYAANLCDIWSCGVVLFVLLVGNTPWDEPTTRGSEEFREYVETNGNTTDELWQQLPPDMISLLLGMLTINPANRFSLQDIKSHPWFRRHNPYLSPSGRNANPVGMATQMLSQLHIDFNRGPSLSQRGVSVSQGTDAMDIDSSSSTFPRRSSAYPTNMNVIANSQPETPLTDTPFDWERPPNLPGHNGLAASQPTGASSDPMFQRGTANGQFMASQQLPSSTQELLSQDPSLSQFSQTANVPMTLTQAARAFKDIIPSHSLARFLSPLPISDLGPLIIEALSHLGVPVAAIPSEQQLAQWDREEKASLRIKMADGRRQGLNGHIVVERIVMADAWVSEVRFVKASGDPLEWRRFFKNVVVSVGERVVVRPQE